MGTATISTDFQYSPFLLRSFFSSLPFYRRFLSKFFERFRISKEEYDNWFAIQNY